MTPVAEQLREKIKSKMEVAKFFSGFIALLIGVLLENTASNTSTQFSSRVGILFLAGSLGYCIAAVFAYDRLLMPADYWTRLSKTERTEDRFHYCLWEEMIRSWSWLFVPAVICFGIGFALTLVPQLNLRYDEVIPPDVERIILTILLVLTVIFPVASFILKGPHIYGDEQQVCGDRAAEPHASTGRPASPPAR